MVTLGQALPVKFRSEFRLTVAGLPNTPTVDCRKGIDAAGRLNHADCEKSGPHDDVRTER